MSTVIDTNTLWYPEIINRLVDHDVVVPTVVLLERARQLRKRGQDPFRFLEDLERLEWNIEAYDIEHAFTSILLAPLGDREWSKQARDAMIAGHVKENDNLWTRNVKDFIALGLPEERIIDPTQ